VETILSLLDKAMQNARLLAIVEFDPALFLFTSALQLLIRKGQDYLKNKKENKKTAADIRLWAAQSQIVLERYYAYVHAGNRYLGNAG
jgi:hypothetical protein